MLLDWEGCGNSALGDADQQIYLYWPSTGPVPTNTGPVLARHRSLLQLVVIMRWRSFPLQPSRLNRTLSTGHVHCIRGGIQGKWLSLNYYKQKDNHFFRVGADRLLLSGQRLVRFAAEFYLPPPFFPPSLSAPASTSLLLAASVAAMSR